VGAGQAIGVSAGVAIDTEGRMALYGSLMGGAGAGAAAGFGMTVQTGSVNTLAGGSSSAGGNFESGAPTTVTAAVGSVQGAVTMPAITGGDAGAGVTGTSSRVGIGGGLFVTQSTTVTTTPTAPVVSKAIEQIKQAFRDGVRAMTCPYGCPQ
jgi:hypothetical protein